MFLNYISLAAVKRNYLYLLFFGLPDLRTVLQPWFKNLKLSQTVN